jgi:hypothetical protein
MKLEGLKLEGDGFDWFCFVGAGGGKKKSSSKRVGTWFFVNFV